MSQPSGAARKGAVDLIFLIDISGSMGPYIEALRTNLGAFFDTLTTRHEQGPAPITDWRARVIGYSDVAADGARWLRDQPFVTDIAALKAQLPGTAQLVGGGDLPESVLDALFHVYTLPVAAAASSPGPAEWRRAVTRVVMLFTDAPAKETADKDGRTVDDFLMTVRTNSRAPYLFIFGPPCPVYDRLSEYKRGEFRELDDVAAFTADRANFAKAMTVLAKTVTKTATAEAAELA